MRWRRFLLGLALCPLYSFAQHGSSATVNPYTTPEDVQAGARLYRGKCAGCHGPEGGGTGAGPALRDGSFKRGASDEALFQTITNGVPGTAMPAFPQNSLETWQIVAHLRTLSVARRAGKTAGDPKAGAGLFTQHCIGCHTTAGSGGLVGPDLTDIGDRQTLAALRGSILRPDESVARAYWSVRATGTAGRSVSGIRLNEDTSSIQLREASGALVSLRRSELREVELVRRSPMPSFEGKLSARELDHLLAFLLAPVKLPATPPPPGGVTAERLRSSGREPWNWLTYHGSYASTHHSALANITRENAAKLELKWIWQSNSLEKVEAAPLVVDGVMYLSDPPGDVVALDARTGRAFWRYRHDLPPGLNPCCGKVNRGLAILGHTLFFATLDAKLVALDASTGRKRWETTVANHRESYSLTLAPLIAGSNVIVGPAGGELGIRGFLAAYDAGSGREVWRFKLIPEPGEPGNETWAGRSWEHGGGSIWLTGSYDPESNVTYWGVGNPGPDWNPSMRRGDNLYTSSVVALDAGTGKLKWHFQFTPNDGWDFDSVQTPVLVDGDWKGRPRKLLLWANRNGFFYVLDRVTGEFLLGEPFVKLTWAERLDAKGRPVKAPGQEPSEKGTLVYPGVQGGTNWYAPSYSPSTGLFYVTAWDDYPGIYFTWRQQYEPGKWFAGGSVQAELPAIMRREIRTWGPEAGYGAVRAIDPATGRRVWEHRMSDVSDSGLLTTASDLLFSGNREGHFFVLDARDGKPLWTRYLGGQVAASPITWAVDGKQFVTIASGRGLFTFGLPD